MLTDSHIAILQKSNSKALATDGPHGVNVVPVSVLTIQDDIIFLYNFFMNKTIQNLVEHPVVALVCWDGTQGIQVKGTVVYHTSGPVFGAAAVHTSANFPKRTLHGVLAITPTAIFDISIS
jgi:predicted pyridoxine 5'-phosphate oxidase superfamily flavin-nucleotide-binding protein